MSGRQFLFIVLSLHLVSAWCAERLSDSLSPIQQVQADLEWKHPIAAGINDFESLTAMQALLPGVEVRLDVDRHMGERAAVYLRLPLEIQGLDQSGALRLSWTAGGRFLSGSVSPGDRALLFKGRIRKPVLRDRVSFVVEVDGRRTYGTVRFDPIFEIETRE